MQIRELLEEEDYEDLMTEGGWRRRRSLRRQFAKRPVLPRRTAVARPAPTLLPHRIVPTPPRCAPCTCPAARPATPVPKSPPSRQPAVPPRNLAPVPPLSRRPLPPLNAARSAPKAPPQPASHPQRLRPETDEGRA